MQINYYFNTNELVYRTNEKLSKTNKIYTIYMENYPTDKYGKIYNTNEIVYKLKS